MQSLKSQFGSTKTYILVACIVVALIGLSGAIALMKNSGQDRDKAFQDASVTSYDECVAAGNPIQESSPEKCSTPSGKTFTNLKSNSQKQF